MKKQRFTELFYIRKEKRTHLTVIKNQTSECKDVTAGQRISQIKSGWITEWAFHSICSTLNEDEDINYIYTYFLIYIYIN